MENRQYLCDTNALLLRLDLLDELYNILIPSPVLYELDKIKMENSDRGFKARKAVRKLKSLDEKVTFLTNSRFNNENNDDMILEVAKTHNCILVTGDFIMQLKAKSIGVEVLDIFDEFGEDEYTGYLEIKINDEQMAKFYENDLTNDFGLLPNQYLILKQQNGSIAQLLKWNGESFDVIRTKQVKSKMFGTLTARDPYQQFALDSLMNNPMTLIKGKAGTGKSLIALSYAMHMIEKGKFDRLICFVNPMATRNSARLGFYKGTKDEKLLDAQIGNMLGSKFGDKSVIEKMIAENELVLLPFSDIRGYDTSGMNAIVYIIEAQNLDIELMKLAIQRVGDDSKLIIDGDYNTQVDSSVYEGSNNGMRRTSEVFRGESYYGEVELPNIYRSHMAKKAEEM